MNEKQQLFDSLSKLSEAQISEMYNAALPRALEINPLKSWTMHSVPTIEDLREVLNVLPLRDCRDLNDLYT